MNTPAMPGNATSLSPTLASRCALVAALLGALVAGCAVQHSTQSGSAAVTSSSATRASIAGEKRRLAALLRGTMATVTARADGSIRVDVPLARSFDSGRAVVKSPLAEVLDHLAMSERTTTTRFLITAPTDPKSRSLLLGTDRAVNARTYMEERGISATRFSVSAIGQGHLVEITLAKA